MNTRIAAIALAMALAAAGAFAQDAAKQEKASTQDQEKVAQVAKMDQFIQDMFKAHQGNTLCMLGNVPVAVVRGLVVEQLKASGVKDSATQQQLESAIWTRFPCPFSPFREEVIPATAKDLEGAWLFPYESQPYRYGPSSPQQPTDPAKAVSCEAVGFYAKGEYRTGTVLGAKTTCPFHKAADLAPARKRPHLLAWSMASDGRLKVARADGKEHIEEWDVYAVTKTFQALNMENKAGDLIAYLRRSKDNDVNAATEFRHLQRLK
jgi:hypothetical protein